MHARKHNATFVVIFSVRRAWLCSDSKTSFLHLIEATLRIGLVSWILTNYGCEVRIRFSNDMDEFINAISAFYPKRIGFSTNRDKTGPG